MINTGPSFTKETHYSAWLFMYLLQAHPNLCGLGSEQGVPCLCYFFFAKPLGYTVWCSGEWWHVLFFLAFKWALSWRAHSLLDNSVMLLFKSFALELQDTLWHTKPDQVVEVLTMILCAVKLHLIYRSILIADNALFPVRVYKDAYSFRPEVVLWRRLVSCSFSIHNWQLTCYNSNGVFQKNNRWHIFLRTDKTCARKEKRNKCREETFCFS